jgi:lipopolysaccharide transport system permease protein
MIDGFQTQRRGFLNAHLHPLAGVTILRPSRGWPRLDLRSLWEYRELLYFLGWRDIKVRYKQTVLGAGWAILQPVLTAMVFSLFFGHLAKMPSDGIPYIVFAYTALLPWIYFAHSLGESSNSLVGGASLISKVYFPRLVVPISSVLAGLLDFAIGFAGLLGLLAWFGIRPTLAMALLPALVMLLLVTTLGGGLWLSALNVQYRDVRYVVPFLIQLGLFATPVAYPSSLLSEPWQTLYGLNPMVGVVEGFRWALLGTNPPGAMIAVSVAASAALVISGILYFRHAERTFADVV